MSRSNPVIHTPNPATRWFEWSGLRGIPEYYDKEKKVKAQCKLPFVFLWLEKTVTIKGWNEPSKSGIYSNEVINSATDPLVVKTFSGLRIAEGLYSNIKSQIVAAGGYWCSNNYIAYKTESGQLSIGALQLDGSSAFAWGEFFKKNEHDCHYKAVHITHSEERKNGAVIFRIPVFALGEVTEETNKKAAELDIQLQDYLKKYFARTTEDRVVPEKTDPEPQADGPAPTEPPPGTCAKCGGGLTDTGACLNCDDVPF